jgi:hypothetical protein
LSATQDQVLDFVAGDTRFVQRRDNGVGGEVLCLGVVERTPVGLANRRS